MEKSGRNNNEKRKKSREEMEMIEGIGKKKRSK